MKYLITNKLQNRKYPPDHHGREGFVRLWDYPSISIFSPDLSFTVKWSSQTMIRSSQCFTRTSSKASRCEVCCLMKSCSSLMGTMFFEAAMPVFTGLYSFCQCLISEIVNPSNLSVIAVFVQQKHINGSLLLAQPL